MSKLAFEKSGFHQIVRPVVGEAMPVEHVGTTLVTTRDPLTPSTPTSVSVGVASTSVLGANTARTGMTLVNVSAARISLAFGTTAILDSGVTLYPGGTFSMDEYDFSTGTVTAIASVAASPLAVQEYS